MRYLRDLFEKMIKKGWRTNPWFRFAVIQPLVVIMVMTNVLSVTGLSGIGTGGGLFAPATVAAEETSGDSAPSAGDSDKKEDEDSAETSDSKEKADVKEGSDSKDQSESKESVGNDASDSGKNENDSSSDDKKNSDDTNTANPGDTVDGGNGTDQNTDDGQKKTDTTGGKDGKKGSDDDDYEVTERGGAAVRPNADTTGQKVTRGKNGEITFTKKAKDSSYVIDVKAKADSGITGSEILSIVEIDDKDELYDEYIKKLNQRLNKKKDGKIKDIRIYDFQFTDKEGNPVDLADKVEVTISYNTRNAPEAEVKDKVRAFTITTEDKTAKATVTGMFQRLLFKAKSIAESNSGKDKDTDSITEADSAGRSDSKGSADQDSQKKITKVKWISQKQTKSQVTKDKVVKVKYALKQNGITGIAVTGKKNSAESKKGASRKKYKYYMSTTGDGYKVTVNYGDDANLPDNVKLSVEEIEEGSDTYDEYLKKASASITGEGQVGSAHFYDISILNYEDHKIEPSATVQVTMEFDPLYVEKTSDVELLHFEEKAPEKGKKGSKRKLSAGKVDKVNMVPGSEKNTVEGVEFETDTLPVYGVVQTTLEKELTASDGKTYKVKVSYDSASGIPAGTELEVTEIKEGDEGYDDYVKKTAEELGTTAGSLTFARAFDITLTDPQTGEKYQPNDKVKVSIQLMDQEIDEDAKVNVVHFAGENGDKPEIVDSKLKGKKVEFETDGFSVFMVAGFTVDFHWGDYTYSITGEDSILLSELFEKLGVTEIGVSDVESVTFSDPALVRVEQKNGDWLLTSLAPFSTDENLTLDLVNGESVTISVTDEPDYTGWTIQRFSGSLTVDHEEAVMYWKIENDTLYIHCDAQFDPAICGNKDGSNAIFTYKSQPWANSMPSIKYMVVTGNMNVLPGRMVQNATNSTSLVSVDLSGMNNLQIIGPHAFYNDNKLTSITWPDNIGSILTTIYGGAFHNVKADIFPEGGFNNVQFIANHNTADNTGSFNNCTGIKTIDFSGSTGLTSIGTNAFNGCSNVTTIDISETGLTSISAFEPCTNLETLIAQNSNLTSPNVSKFGKLTTLDLSGSSSVASIRGLDNCAKLENVNLSGTTITNLDLSGKPALISVTLPESVRTINLSGCSKLPSVTLNEGVETVNLSGCSKLTSVDLPESVKTVDLSGTGITYLDLKDKTNLTSVILPAGVTTVDLTNTGVTALDLDGCSALTSLTLPGTISSLTNIPSGTGLEIHFNGTRAQWGAKNISLPQGTKLYCTDQFVKDGNLNEFLDLKSSYIIGDESTSHPITEPVVTDTTDEAQYTMNLVFSEYPDGDPEKLPHQMRDGDDAGSVLYYTLPDNSNVVMADPTYNETIELALDHAGHHAIGTVVYEPAVEGEGGHKDRLKLTWSFSANATPEEIANFQNKDDISFSLEVPFKITAPVEVNFGSDENEVPFVADSLHNPKFNKDQTTWTYNKTDSKITYTTVITAEGDIDNLSKEYPVVIGAPETGDALSFDSASYSYAAKEGNSGSVVKWADNTSGMETTEDQFPLTVEHMKNGDTITITYTAAVDTDKIKDNGNPTEEEAGFSIGLTNFKKGTEEPNPFNLTDDDTESVLAGIVYPELIKTLEGEPVLDTNGSPVYKFTAYVSSISDSELTEGKLVLTDIFDVDTDGSATDDAGNWTLCTDDGHAAKAYGLTSLKDDLPTAPNIALTSESTQDGVNFKLSNLKDTNNNYYNFYKIIYYIKPKDINALNSFKTRAYGAEKHTLTFKNQISLGDQDPATAEYTYKYLPLTKDITEIDGNWVSYKIVINPDKFKLNNGGVMKLNDTFSKNQSVDYSSIRVTADPAENVVSYDYTNQTGTFMIKDETSVTIQYRSRIKVVSGQNVTFNNTAQLLGTNDDPLFKAEAKKTQYIYPGGDDIAQTDKSHSVWLYKYAEDHMETGLGGARFRLLDSHKDPILYKRGGDDIKGKEITFVTASDDNENVKGKGYVEIKPDPEGGVAIQKNTVYYLEEMEPLVVGNTHYKKDDTLYSFMITDIPNYNTGSAYQYFDGDIVKVRNYVEDPNCIYISKRFAGNVSLADEDKDKITFTIEKWDTSTSSWITPSGIQVKKPVKDGTGKIIGWEYQTGSSGTYADFEWGNYLNFKVQGSLQAGDKYRVVESSADPSDNLHRTTWEVTNGTVIKPEDSGQTTEQEVQFTVRESGHSANILCTNEYVENKLTIRKTDAENGKLLGGAKFAVFNMAGQTIKSDYVTESEDEATKGTFEIKKGDDGRYQFNTLYYTSETHAPSSYTTPDDPQRVYFYFSGNGITTTPPGLPSGEEAVDLSTGYDTVTVENHKSDVEIPVIKVWDLKDGNGKEWPDNVDHVIVGLYYSISGSAEEPVTDDDKNPLTLKLDKAKPYKTFPQDAEQVGQDETNTLTLPATDTFGNPITYTVKELHVYEDGNVDKIADYAPAYSVSDAGVRVIRNSDGISVDVEKKWFDGEIEITGNPLDQKPTVSYDLYRSTSDLTGDPPFDRTAVKNKVSESGSELVQAGLTLGKSNDWKETVSSLKKYDDTTQKNPYYYFALEVEGIAETDQYEIVAAQENNRKLTIKNNGETNPVCKIGSVPFYSISDAVAYAVDLGISAPTIEMLRDYIIPVTDAVRIPAGYQVTLTTASTSGELPYKPPADAQGRDTALITRYTTFTDRPVFTTELGGSEGEAILGTLSLRNITLDGASIPAEREMICNEGGLTLSEGATIQNVVSSGKGGAVYAGNKSETTIAGGIICANQASYGGAIYASGGLVRMTGGTIGGDAAAANKARYDGGAIYYAGTGSVSLEGGTLQGNQALDGDGGAVFAASGNIVIDGAVLRGNTAGQGNGGAVYGQNAVIAIQQTDGKTTSIKGNSARNGGAVYTKAGSVTLTDGTIGGTEGGAPNTATQNGGAIYTVTGSVSVEGGSLQGNQALVSNSGKGGAIYADSGTVYQSGGSMTKNQAENGSAVFVNTGTGYFSGGVIGGEADTDANIASNGGAVGIGSDTARLFFSGTIRIVGNKMTSGAKSNVYLDQDSDTILNADSLVSNNTSETKAEIGVYVPNKEVTVDGKTVDLYSRRGIPGSKFATYTGKDVNNLDNKGNPKDVTQNTFINIFKHDRVEGLKAISDTSVKRILWGKTIKVQVRYLNTYSNGFPPKNSNGNWMGDLKYGGNNFIDFYPASSDSAMSEVADNLRSRVGTNVDQDAVYGHSYLDNAATFDDYLTRLYWDTSAGEWKVEKRDGTSVTCEKVVIFFTEASYISIENNTGNTLHITSLKVLGHEAENKKPQAGQAGQAGYGYVTAHDGETNSALTPVTEEDLTLAGITGVVTTVKKGESVKMLFPGGVNSAYTLEGYFDGYNGADVYRTIKKEDGTYGYDQSTVPNDFRGENDRLSGNTLEERGATYEIIFGEPKPICKIVEKPNKIVEVIEEGDILSSQPENDGNTAYLFSTISQAVEFVKKQRLTLDVPPGQESETKPKGAKIEMLVDYLLPSSDRTPDEDKIVLPKDYRLTFTTAAVGQSGVVCYEGKPGVTRATISRDSGNRNSFLTVLEGSMKTELIIENLNFDGRNLAGSSDGGAIKTKDCKVTINNADFTSFIAGNGGAIFIEYGDVFPVDKNDNYETAEDKIERYLYWHGVRPDNGETETECDRTLSVSNAKFNDCESNSTLKRQGGGAIWTNANTFTLSDAEFKSCIADDQGGAVFHRIDRYVPGSSSTVSNCKFESCQAKAAGAYESDASSMTMTNCTYNHCNALVRNGGAVNVYSNNQSDSQDPCVVTVSGCTFNDCHSDNVGSYYGGALRSAALDTSVYDCTFINTSSYIGGAVAMSNKNGSSATVSGCSISYASSQTNGGGIYALASVFDVSNTTVINCTAGNSGGGIYHNRNGNGTSETYTNCTITGCKATSSTAGNGGGLFMSANTCTLTECTIQSNTSGTNGGALFDNNGGTLVLDECLITGNSSNGKGGAVYTKANITLRNDTLIMGNRLAGDNGDLAENAAGVYIDGKQLIVGTENAAAADNSSVKENYTANGGNSNLRLRMNSANTNNDTNSVKVNCDLGGKIFVINAASRGTQFGSSLIKDPRGFADFSHVFTADDGSLYGIVDRSDTNGKKLIWAGTPICKITDTAGNLLFFDADHTQPAIFDKLDVGDSTKQNKSSAFSFFRMSNFKLYKQDGLEWTEKTYQIRMLEDYTAANAVFTPDREDIHITLTTANLSEKDGFPYKGSSGTRAVITRGTGTDVDFMTVSTNLTIQNLVLDGGCPTNSTTTLNSQFIKMASRYTKPDIELTLASNARIQNSHVAGDGGAVYVDKGSFVLNGGTIQNCFADGNGGAVHAALLASEVRVTSGLITNCAADKNGNNDGNGGGVYLKGGELIMSDGSITRCSAFSGGGVFVDHGKSMSMSGGRITSNNASGTGAGGGIAVGQKDDTKVIFSGNAYVFGNHKGSNEECNLELDQDTNAIITANNLISSASIGVYVPGVMDKESSYYNEDDLYWVHGDADTPFGNYILGSKTDNLRCFINDRNKLRGGTKSDGEPNTIYWVRIYFLEVKKTLLSDRSTDKNKEFEFKVTLTGEGKDKENNTIDAESITNAQNSPKEYGDMRFTKGVATFKLSAGQSVMADNLPGGLNYKVEELTSSDYDLDDFTTVYSKDGKKSQNGRQAEGKIGTTTGAENYLSSVEFINIHAICKITTDDNEEYPQDQLLYYKEAGSYEPAVYSRLYATKGNSAFYHITSGKQLYVKTVDENDDVFYTPYRGNYHVEMLVSNYDMAEAAYLNTDKKVTLTTADKDAEDGYPYSGGDETAEIRRGYDGKSMIQVQKGTLVLDTIKLNGNRDEKDVTGDGGIVTVGRPSSSQKAYLEIDNNAELYNSKATKGGAVYVTSMGEVTIRGGSIKDNMATDNGAGIYLNSASVLKIQGNPDFGGSGLYTNTDTIPEGKNVGDIKDTGGNFVVKEETSFKTGSDDPKNGGRVYPHNNDNDYLVRQDIYIAETEAIPASVIVGGKLTGDKGTIWVWADSENHYKTLMPFATLGENVTDAGSVDVFRNAQPDGTTANPTSDFLYGTLTGDPPLGSPADAKYVYWNGSTGSRKVILRKVEAGTYNAVPLATLTVYRKGNISSPVVVDNLPLQNLPSLVSGVFWIGELPYDEYWLCETSIPDGYKHITADDPEYNWFILTVSENGVGTKEADESFTNVLNALQSKPQ